MAATFKFVSSNHAGPTRLQSSKACDICRRRKKRCLHGGNASNYSSVNTGQSPTLFECQTNPGSQTSIPDRQETVDSEVDEEVPQPRSHNQETETNSLTAQNPRFIGDLNPESIFLAAISPDTTRGRSLDDSVGVWLNSSMRNHGSRTTSHVLQSPSNIFYRSSSLIQKVLVPMLEQDCFSTVPPPDCLKALERIYFEKIQPILPLVSESMLHSTQPSTPELTILQQGICLAASKDPAARKHLMLNDAPLLNRREFGEKLSDSMRIMIEMGLVTDKIVLIKAFALLSQFADDPPGEDLSSQYCIRAVHQTQSLGLHVKGHKDVRDQSQTTLLCCIWAIDRMNAAFKGRPVSMHERDLRKDLYHCFHQQDQTFRLVLEIIALLDKVIGLYRPQTNPAESSLLDMEFPSFEEIALKCSSSLIGAPALASIEIFYHSVAILSCRTRSWIDPERSSTAFLRQSLSTSTLSIIFSNTPQDQLSLFPFIPYAISLSMSIVYREMRYSKLSTHRARARSQFQTLCEALSGLEGIFWSASTIADMGKRLLLEMDRVSSTIFSSEASTSSRTVAAGLIHQDPAPGSAARDVGSSTPDIHQPDLHTQDFNLSNHDTATDIDLFGLFDPAFDLAEFDAFLEANINPGFNSGLH